MRFVSRSDVKARLAGKTVAIVGSGPSVLENPPKMIDGHDVVVRVNNYKLLGPETGQRTDVHYSFYGNSVRKQRQWLEADGVSLCMCKCPNSKPLSSDWHERSGRIHGIDFRYIYELRKDFWFCDTYVPTDEEFLAKFRLLGDHIPTTGFSALLDVVNCEPKSVYLTGFDFFLSGRHNVDEAWRAGSPDDPIGHRPDIELHWLATARHDVKIEADPTLIRLIGKARAASRSVASEARA